MMRKLLEAMTKFAGQPEQKPGEQWKGTDKGTPGNKLVGSADESVLKDLSKGKTPKTKEQELAEEWAMFSEEDIGTHPKRPGRTSDRHSRGHEPLPRYKTVKTDESMSDKDIELQDYRSMSDKEFQNAYKMTKTEWINKNKSLVIKNPDIKKGLGLDEAGSPAQQAAIAIAIAMKKAGKKPKQVDEGADTEYTVHMDRNGRERSTSGTIAELLDYFGYTLEVGKSYEHEKGRYKINMNPTSIGQLIDALNKAQSNSAANGQASTHYSMNEGVAYKTANPHPASRDPIVAKVLKQMRPGLTGLDMNNEAFLYFAYEIGKMRAREMWEDYGPAIKYFYQSGIGVNEDANTDNKLAKLLTRFVNQHEGTDRAVALDAIEYIKKIGHIEQFATSLDYFGVDLDEGWESGPEEYEEPYDDADDAYDRQRQEKIDTEAEKEWAKLPKVSTYQCTGRGANMEPNQKFGPEFDTLEKALEYRAEIMKDPKTPNPTDIGIRTISRVAESKADTTGSWVVHSGSKVKRFKTRDGAKAYAEKNGGKVASSEFYADKVQKDINEDVTSTDPLEGALLNAIQELVSQGHKDVDPMVLTNMVVAATSRPFLLKDLVDANNNSLAVQHYIDSISPSKVKFSTDTLTVKNEDPNKDKTKARAGVSSMASRAANRPRLGEGTETPLQNKDDYNAKRKALQDIQLDPDTAKDPQLKAELARRLGSLNQQYTDLQSKLREFKESRGHKAIATKLGNMDRMQNVQVPSPAERREQLRIAKAKEEVGKKQVKEFAAPGAVPTGTVQTANPTPATPGASATTATDPAAKQQAQKVATATSTIKSATGSTVAAPALATALDTASQGKASPTDMKALAPIMGVVDAAAADPKLAGQFKTLATQAQQSLKAQQKP